MRNLWNKIKDWFKKLVAWFKSLLRKTDLDNKALELLLNQAVELFIDEYENKAYRSFKSMLKDFEKSVKDYIANSENKVDDMLVPFIIQAFDKVSVEFEKVFNKENVKATIINLKTLILNEYEKWENKK